jgi:hypothetical protein
VIRVGLLLVAVGVLLIVWLSLVRAAPRVILIIFGSVTASSFLQNALESSSPSPNTSPAFFHPLPKDLQQPRRKFMKGADLPRFARSSPEAPDLTPKAAGRRIKGSPSDQYVDGH